MVYRSERGMRGAQERAVVGSRAHGGRILLCALVGGGFLGGCEADAVRIVDRRQPSGPEPQSATQERPGVRRTPTGEAAEPQVPSELAPLEPERSPSPCAAIPSAFRLLGCGLSEICQVQQEGCEATVHCGTLTTSLNLAEGSGGSIFFGEGENCVLQAEGGELAGSCTGGSLEEQCRLQISGNFIPHPACIELPQRWELLEACTLEGDPVAGVGCEVVQHGCEFQALCGPEGEAYVGRVGNEGLSLRHEGMACEGAIVDSGLQGSCAAIGEDAGPPSCPLVIQAPADPNARECAEIVPEQGFALAGCARDGQICHLSQRSCVWNLTCGAESYSGRLGEDGQFEFTSLLGASCQARVVAGEFEGECSWGAESCVFSHGTPELDESCLQLPAEFELERCGATLGCVATQNACDWQANCGGGAAIYTGLATEEEILFAEANGGGCQGRVVDGEILASCPCNADSAVR